MLSSEYIIEQPHISDKDLLTNECENPFDSVKKSLKPMNSPSEVAKASGICEGTLSSWRCSGRGPKFVKVGKSVLYPREEVLSYLKSHLFQSTTEAMA